MIRLEGDSPNLTLTQHAGCTFGVMVVLQERGKFFSVKKKWRGIFFNGHKQNINDLLCFKGSVIRDRSDVSVLCRVCPAGGSHAVQAVSERHYTSCIYSIFISLGNSLCKIWI